MTGDRCKFMVAVDVQCPLPSIDHGYCVVHRKKTCGHCRGQATRSCDVPGELICYIDLCDDPRCRRQHAERHLEMSCRSAIQSQIDAYIEDL